MTRTIIHSQNAPAAIGPYSQAVSTGNLLFVSGQIGIDPETGTLVKGGIAEETHRILQNLEALCDDAGSSLAQVIKTTLFLTDMSHFKVVNEIYAGYFKKHPPARSTVAVVALPLNALIEIEAIVGLP